MSLFTSIPKCPANIPAKNTNVMPKDTPKNFIRPRYNPTADTIESMTTACIIVGCKNVSSIHAIIHFSVCGCKDRHFSDTGNVLPPPRAYSPAL